MPLTMENAGAHGTSSLWELPAWFWVVPGNLAESSSSVCQYWKDKGGKHLLHMESTEPSSRACLFLRLHIFSNLTEEFCSNLTNTTLWIHDTCIENIPLEKCVIEALMKCPLELQPNLWRTRIHDEWLSFHKNLQDLKSNFKFAEQFQKMLFAEYDCFSKIPQYQH